MISHELTQIWICSDGKRFLKKSEAEKHEKKLKDNQNDYIEWNK
tara:strand:- start:1579 stop:1710 length:132 start_codon:yes stop_codon:yes gene_type:complete